ncbi:MULTISPECIES: histidine kinase [Aerococcus]|uniref:histidine kinase n=1 Tax=Aerococcus TaxID=1375 RepID=UPI000DCBA656|nr:MULTISPECIES: histidine kinase [Aerococcus]MDL5183603.1 histidine kinase [Aerococcus mictus]KAA9299549.1 histidine kinase [Aerococcus tenax]MDK6291422.1 histidine kinase [Aerococcus urinae]MDK6372431.1 histidine kinase [Aerococcus urinae]MDK6375852.1 histidine kinase [Aerococcus urinae]
MEDVNKLTDEEVGAIIQARYNAESLQPETEEDRKSVEERWKKINKMSCERLKKQGYNVELSSDGLKIKIIEKTNH